MIAMKLAALGFLASAAAHLLSFTPWGRLVGERTIWTLGTGVFVLALWMIARLRQTAAIRRQWGRVALHDWRGLVAAVPPGWRFLVIGAALYAWMNFVLCLMVEEGAVAHAAITLRMATGHLLFFYIVPLVFFGWVDPAHHVAGDGEAASWWTGKTSVRCPACRKTAGWVERDRLDKLPELTVVCNKCQHVFNYSPPGG